MWQYQNPVQVRFGSGVFSGIPELIAGRRYGLVTYDEPFFDGLTRDIARKAGPPVVTISDVQPNPDYVLLNDQVTRTAPADGPEVWVALGGGSVIDTAKVLAAANGAFSNVSTFLESGSGAETLSAVPIIAVPTTAGTGSEVTCWATVWKEESGQKFSLARSNLYPEVAVVDPELMLEKPLGLTISTGLDALSHALESLWNVNANPVSANHAVFASREVISLLPRLVDNLNSLDLRSRMAQASLFAGLAFSNTKTAISHSLSYPISLKHNVPHGIACSFSLPIVIESVKDIGGLCESSLRRVFDDDTEGAAGKVAGLLERCGVSVRPLDHGVTDEEWAGLVDDAFDGERGRNFIGGKAQFLTAAEAFGAAAPR